MARDADTTNNIRLRYLRSPDSEALDSQLYIFKNQKKIIKDQVKKSFGQMINSLYPFYWHLPRKDMKGKKAVIVTGIGIMIMGVIFHLQGQSIVGPESSFMYSNPQWITYGIQIIISGGIILAIGMGLSFIKRD